MRNIVVALAFILAGACVKPVEPRVEEPPACAAVPALMARATEATQASFDAALAKRGLKMATSRVKTSTTVFNGDDDRSATLGGDHVDQQKMRFDTALMEKVTRAQSAGIAVSLPGGAGVYRAGGHTRIACVGFEGNTSCDVDLVEDAHGKLSILGRKVTQMRTLSNDTACGCVPPTMPSPIPPRPASTVVDVDGVVEDVAVVEYDVVTGGHAAPTCPYNGPLPP